MANTRKPERRKPSIPSPVSERMVRHGMVVANSGNAPLIAAVTSGNLAVDVAEKLARRGATRDQVRRIAEAADTAVANADPEQDADKLRAAIYRREAARLLKKLSGGSKSRSARETPSGEPIPDQLSDIFERRQRLLNLVTITRSRFQELVSEPIPGVTEMSFIDILPPETLSTLRIWVDDVLLHLPEELCPVCSGAGCDICTHGWLSKASRVQLAPKLKAAALRRSPSKVPSRKKQR